MDVAIQSEGDAKAAMVDVDWLFRLTHPVPSIESLNHAEDRAPLPLQLKQKLTLLWQSSVSMALGWEESKAELECTSRQV